LDALAHFGGRLVGEGDGANLRRGEVGAIARLQQARDFVRDHPRLARPCTGQHQTGTVQVLHGGHLGRVHHGRGSR